MAIQNRRGIYSDFDPTKMVEGEFAVVQSGDPNTSDGKAVYIAPTTGTAERVALYKDLQQEVQAAITDATDEVIQEVTAGIIEGVAEDVTKAETAATNAETSAQNAEASAEEAQEVLENKADNNGYYPDLYAGNLSSTRKQTDSTPYLMRKTGGSLSRIGEREDDTLVGATVNVNQLCRELSSFAGQNATISVNESEATLTATANAQTAGYVGMALSGDNVPVVISSHKYVMSVNIKTAVSNPHANLSYGNNTSFTTSLTSGTWNPIATIKTTTTPSGQYIQVRVFGTFATGDTVTISDMQIIDLTAMLGSTIADYLYNLETATAGAGIAKLREWGFLTDGYIPYNAGSLESVEARSHVMRGFNQWDEEWELGIINTSTGQNEANNVYFRSKNYIPIIPDTTYYYKVNPAYSDYGRFAYYDGNKNLIGYVGTANVVNRKFITPANACYMRFWTGEKMSAATGQNPVYANDICINLSNLDRNGEYEPYSTHTYDLGSDTLRGLFKLDSNNNLYADGDTKTSDGTVTRKYGVVDLGTLNYAYNSDDAYFYATISDLKNNGGWGKVSNVICDKYVTTFPNNISSADKAVCVWNSGNRLIIRDTAYTDAATFKEAMSGVLLVYELATPTTEQSTSFTNPQICDPDGTEEYVTSNGVPVGHETEYDYDIKGLAEELIDVPDVPSTNGTYVLKAIRSASGISYEWVSEA